MWSRVLSGGGCGVGVWRKAGVGWSAKGGVWSKKVKVLREGRWSLMSDMLVGCDGSWCTKC